MEVRFDGDANVTLASEVARKKAKLPIDVTLDGILTDVRPDHSNTFAPIVSSKASEAKVIVPRELV